MVTEEQVQTKRIWVRPELTIHGAVETITQLREPKNKTYGAGDDVLVNNEAILGDMS